MSQNRANKRCRALPISNSSQRRANKRCRALPRISYLPQDLLVEILLRLCVKSLVRFKAVARCFKTIIESPDFILKHSSQNKYNTEKSHVLFVEQNRSSAHKQSCTVFRPGAYDFTKRICFSARGDYSIKGYVGGILLIAKQTSNYNVEDLILFNPSIQKAATIPLLCPLNLLETNISLGFDNTTHEHKVVVIKYPFSPNKCEGVFDISVAIFGLKMMSWKKFNTKTSFVSYDFKDKFKVFHNGSIHCIASNTFAGKKNWGTHIRSFDVRTETFNYTELPEKHFQGGSRTLAVLHGSLVLVDDNTNTNTSKTCIWMMDKNDNKVSWSQIYTTDLKPLLIMEDGKLICGQKHNGISKALTYDDLDSEDKIELKYARKSVHSKIYTDTYVESLMWYNVDECQQFVKASIHKKGHPNMEKDARLKKLKRLECQQFVTARAVDTLLMMKATT